MIVTIYFRDHTGKLRHGGVSIDSTSDIVKDVKYQHEFARHIQAATGIQITLPILAVIN